MILTLLKVKNAQQEHLQEVAKDEESFTIGFKSTMTLESVQVMLYTAKIKHYLH